MSTLDSILLDSDGTENFIKGLMSSLVYSTKASNSMPNEGSDFDYYSTFEKFSSESNGLSDSITSLIRRVCAIVDPSTSSIQISSDFMESSLYELVVDMIDILLEGADLNLDSASGVRSDIKGLVKEVLTVDRDRIFREATQNIPKPQLAFLDEIDNARTHPFRPKIRSKPHALTPLDISEVPITGDDEESVGYVGPSTKFPHPYEEEIKAFGKRLQHSQPAYIVNSAYVNPVMPLTAAARPFEFVDTVAALQAAAEEIENSSELAIDLEHHSHRSFQGITCLIQISTREKDYIFDAIALRRDLQSAFLSIFTDPEVVKVFHGCDSDILWLQRDFGLYVVNCFDTYHAAKALRYPALSLAHLLKYHCGITLNKKHQLSDWRVRPLPEDMMQYARSDTQHLLFIYDCLRRDVHAAQGAAALQAVWTASMHTCLKRYEKEPFNPMGYTRLFTDSRGWSGAPAAVDISTEQHNALASVWNWRDLMARHEDESTLYIMSNAELLRIGKAMPLTEESLLACAPLSSFVRAHKDDLLKALGETLGVSSKSGAKVGPTSDTSSNAVTEARTPGRSVAAPIREAWSVEEAMLARHGQIRRLEGCMTVSEILPSVAMTPVKSYKDRSTATAASPGAALYLASTGSVMGGSSEEGDDAPPPGGAEWEQLFSEAMWNSSGQAPPVLQLHRTAESPVDALLRAMSPTSMSAGTRSRLERVVEQLHAKNKLPTGSAVDSPAFVSLDMSQKQHSEVSASPSRPSSTPSPTVDSLPQSLTEIYDISNRNRWRNKDKKRNRDPGMEGGDHVMAEEERKDEAGSTGEDDWYNSGQDAFTDKGLEGTLDLATDIGWVKSASREEIMRKHLADEHINATAQLQSPSGDDLVHDQGAHADTSSDKRASSKGSSGGGAKPGSTGIAHSKTGFGSKSRSNSGERPKSTLSSPFDYSSMPQSASSMGAMIPPSSGSSGAAPSSTAKFSQGGQQKRSNSKDRGNSKERAGSKKTGGVQHGRGGGAVERRDRDRSMVTSTNK